MPIHPLEAELFHEDGQTDGHDVANDRFTQFCKCTKNLMHYR